MPEKSEEKRMDKQIKFVVVYNDEDSFLGG